MYVTPAETPLFWETLEARAASPFTYSERVYAATSRLTLSFPGSLCGQESSPTEALAWYHETVNWEVQSIHYFCGGCVQCMGEGEVGEEPTHQPGCFDPYGKAAWCDCNNLTRADACLCDGDGCIWCQF